MENETKRAMVKGMVDKAPPPDEMDAYGGEEETTPAEKDEAGDDASEMSAARDVMKAVKSDDVEAFKAAMKDFISYCK